MRRRMMRQTSSNTSFSDEEAMRSSGGNMAQDSSRKVSDIETEPTVDQNEFMGDESLEDPREYHSFQMQEGPVFTKLLWKAAQLRISTEAFEE
ncbi:hypothetical protein DPMN_064259 [Dreissena polymorpha]|uniref:Uncharacterized protein n=1 Tax=Dreissena polymorpha TaxID=45954 RepID=A0A9D4HL02_DREPO|nr:hypothetical protein DPMN_064259 [Dreissena polymorpha]